MSRIDQQWKLFSDDGPSWCSFSNEQQYRLADLLSDLLVQYLESRELVVRHEPPEPKEDHDAREDHD